MPALPFDPVDLAPALPDVAWAIGIAFILAVVTYRPPKPAPPPTMDDAIASMSAAPVAATEAPAVTVIDAPEDGGTDGSAGGESDGS